MTLFITCMGREGETIKIIPSAIAALVSKRSTFQKEDGLPVQTIVGTQIVLTSGATEWVTAGIDQVEAMIEKTLPWK